MNVRILGLEGSVPPGTLVAWGAAAIDDGVEVRNNHTGAVISRSEVERLALEGHLTRIDNPIEIASELGYAPIILAMVDRTLDRDALFQPEASELAAVRLTTERWHYYAFVSPDEFSKYAEIVGTRVVRAVLYARNMSNEAARELVRASLVLQPDSPELNALLVYLAPVPEVVRRLLQAALKDQSGSRNFDLLLYALQARGKRELFLTVEELFSNRIGNVEIIDDLRIGYQNHDEIATTTSAEFEAFALSALGQ